MLSYFSGFLIVVILFYAAVVHGSGALALLGCVVLGLMVFSFITILICRWGLQANLQIPITLTQQGNALKVNLNKTHRGKIYHGKVVFVIRMENTSLKEKTVIRQKMKEGAEGTFFVTPLNAGHYELSVKRIRVYDLTGLFYLTKKCKESASFLVLPEYYPVEVRLSESARNFVGEALVYDSLRSGDDASEVFKLREFQDGDKLKNIHWKLSAKMDELIVRENGFPKACSTVLVLEGAGEVSGRRALKQKPTDAFLKLAASLSFSVMDRDCPHYVAWQSKRYQDVKRIRVDDEESFYEFLIYLLQDFDRESSNNCLEQYKEKYSAEVLLHHLVLGQDLVLTEKETNLASFDKENVEKSLTEFELLL